MLTEEVRTILLLNEMWKRPNHYERLRFSGGDYVAGFWIQQIEIERRQQSQDMLIKVCHFCHQKGQDKRNCKYQCEWLKKEGSGKMHGIHSSGQV